MATGPEHYREAERIVAMATDAVGRDGTTDVSASLAAAQVHATLALAAATAAAGRASSYASETSIGMHEADYRAWNKVVGEPR